MPSGKAQDAIRRIARRFGFIQCLPMSKRKALPSKFDVHLPLLVQLIPAYPINTTGVVGANPLVHHVLLMSNVPKIRNSIVRRITIDVVNRVLWPFAMHNSPDNSVSCKLTPKKGSSPSAGGINRVQRWPSGILAVPSGRVCRPSSNPLIWEVFGRPRSPSEQPGLRIVIEKFAAKFGCDIGSDSHAKSPFVWSGPREGATSFAARFFYQNHPLFAKKTGVIS